MPAWTTLDYLPSLMEMQKWRTTSAYWLGSCREPKRRQLFDTNPALHCSTGQPRLFLDNRSNFQGVTKHIRRRPLMLDHDYNKYQPLNQSVEWKLNPPTAHYFGGCWRDSFSVSNKLFSWTSVLRNSPQMSLPQSFARPSVFSTRVHSPTWEALRRRQTTYFKPLLAWKNPLQIASSRSQRDTCLEEFGMDTGEAENSADLEEAANLLCSFPEQTTEVDV